MITPQQAILAICINQANIAAEIIGQLSTQHFEEGINVRLFHSIQELLKQEKQVNTINLFYLSKNAKIATKDDVLAIISWESSLTYQEKPIEIIWTVKDELIKKRLLVEAQLVIKKIIDGSDGLSTAIDYSQTIRQIIESQIDTSNILTPEIMMDNETASYERRAMLYASGNATGVETGIKSINQFTGGWQNGELIIIAGRPSMGKTALALFHMVEAAKTKKSVVFFNLEMNESQLSQRLLINSTNAEIDPQRLKLGKLSQPEMHRFIQARGLIEEMPFIIYDKAGATISEIVRTIKIAHRNKQCDLVVIDYLQLIASEGSKKAMREQEVANISRTLKQTAKELDIPIIALAQLSRDVEKRGGLKKPMLSDLRESGAIEQDADVVLFVWRPAYYNLQTDDGHLYKDEIFYLIEKNRTGAVGEAEFMGNYCLSNFSDKESFKHETVYLPYKDDTKEVKSSMQPNDNWETSQIDF